jgi:integrase
MLRKSIFGLAFGPVIFAISAFSAPCTQAQDKVWHIAGEVGRLLASMTNIKHKAALSLTYPTGLRSSQVVSLKLTDIDSDRMVIRVDEPMPWVRMRL